MNPAFMRPRRSPPSKKSTTDPFWYRYRFSLFSGLFILVALLAPGNTFSGMTIGIPNMDKIVHGAMFFIFSLCISVEYRKDKGKLPGLWFAVALLAAFALTTEALQLLASGRSFDLRDGLADLIGALAARILTGIIYRTRSVNPNISPAFHRDQPGNGRPVPTASRGNPPRVPDNDGRYTKPRMTPGASQRGSMPQSPRPGTGRSGAPIPPSTYAGREQAPGTRSGTGGTAQHPPKDDPGGQQNPS